MNDTSTPGNNSSILQEERLAKQPVKTGLVLSGGGVRASYQVGALRALLPYLTTPDTHISVVVGSSIGAINSLIVAACLKDGLSAAVTELDQMWRVRNFRNTFSGTPSQAFFRAIKTAVVQYMAPGPFATTSAIFDPSPLMREVDLAIHRHGGLAPEDRHPELESVAVMTTVEGKERRPLLFLSSTKKPEQHVLSGASFDVCYVNTLAAKHGFASAALPSVLPPVELDVEGGTVRLVDGGISQNVPVDPAVRLGSERVVVLDVSGRDWWNVRDGEGDDIRPTWEVAAELKTFCLRPPATFVVRCQKPLGPILKQAVSGSRRKFMRALGPVWPVFTILKNKLGEEIAYEAMTYVALDEDYIAGLIECGYQEAQSLLGNKSKIAYERPDSYEQWASSL